MFSGYFEIICSCINIDYVEILFLYIFSNVLIVSDVELKKFSKNSEMSNSEDRTLFINLKGNLKNPNLNNPTIEKPIIVQEVLKQASKSVSDKGKVSHSEISKAYFLT